MNFDATNPTMSNEALLAAANTALEQTAARLRETLNALALRLRPFPAFLNMMSVQAIELEPLPGSVAGSLARGGADRGCVVVTPEGLICQFDLRVIPGIAGLNETDHVEEFQELELPDEEYICYAAMAIRLLAGELGRRGG